MASSDEEDEISLNFHEMGLDDRLLKAIAILGWTQPTLVQEKAIPLALDGNDILARARTGSGKTAVFALPVIDKILKYKQSNHFNRNERKTHALIIAPSKELCHQLKEQFNRFTQCCIKDVKCVDVASLEVNEVKPLLISSVPEIIIGTPGRILAHVRAGSLLNLKKNLQSLVVDEADLIFSFGFEDDMQQLIEAAVPSKSCQSYLVSATLNPDVINLKNLVLSRPVVVKLEEPELPKCEQLAQYHISCQEDEKFVVLISLIKLNLLRGRTIIFVNALNRCYKLKLFLEQFAVKSCLLNPELPVATRCHVVDQFNRGLYSYIIACDERTVHDPTVRRKGNSNGKTTTKSDKKLDKNYAVSRGIDFQSVSNVINFDFPTTIVAYVHRVGRTARALNAVNSNIVEGTVLSFVAQDENKYFTKIKQAFGDAANFKPYSFKMDELEAFKYRSKDAIRAVTKDVIRTARMKEIQNELKNSIKIKSILKANPNDLELLRHDRTIRRISTQDHLKDVPDYIVPQTLKIRQQASRHQPENQFDLTAPTSKKTVKKKLKTDKKKLAQNRRNKFPTSSSSKKRRKFGKPNKNRKPKQNS